tara:strand:+ start:41 stop:280 length:240 start_codon:yes stop_codon:yes gene_type:complete
MIMDLPGDHTDQLRSGKKVEKYLNLFIKKALHKLLHGDKLIYGGWIPHLCFNSEITISKNQLSSKSEYLKFRIVNFKIV